MKIASQSLLALALISLASCASTSSDVRSTDAPKMDAQMPWSEAEMAAYTAAATPGAHHKLLTDTSGSWTGTCTIWMSPDQPPVTTPVTGKFTSMFDGRYIECEYQGDGPMGPFHGKGVYGYDNVDKQFVSSWYSNCGTSIMNGEGQLSKDGKTIDWTYACTCPLRKKPTTMREMMGIPDANTMKIETWGEDPRSGKEYKMSVIEMHRVGS